MIFGFQVGGIILFSGLHFILSGLVGLLVLWLISTTSLRTMVFNTWKESGHLDRSIFPWLLLLMVSLSIVAHVLEDCLARWF